MTRKDELAVDTVTRLATELYGKRAVIRSRAVQTPGEPAKMHWWVDCGPRSPEVIAADSFVGLGQILLQKKRGLTARSGDARLPGQQENKQMNATSEVTGSEKKAEKLLSAIQGGAYLGVAPTTLAHWAGRGQIKASKVPGTGRHGWQYRFTRADLDEYAASHKITSRKAHKRGATGSRKWIPSKNGSKSHPQMSGDVAARIKKLAAKIESSHVIEGLQLRITPTSIYRAALLRGLDALEKEIKS